MIFYFLLDLSLRQDIAEIFRKLALNSNQSTNLLDLFYYPVLNFWNVLISKRFVFVFHDLAQCICEAEQEMLSRSKCEVVQALLARSKCEHLQGMLAQSKCEVVKGMSHVEQELFTLPEHMSSPLVFSRVRVARSLSFCVMFVGHCVVCPSIYGF